MRISAKNCKFYVKTVSKEKLDERVMFIKRVIKAINSCRRKGNHNVY